MTLLQPSSKPPHEITDADLRAHSVLMASLTPEFTKFFTYLFTRVTSAFLIVFGRRRTGKTDLSLLIAQIVHARGLITHFATNTRIYGAPFPIEKITDLDTLREWSAYHSGRKLFMFDEYGKAFKRRTPMCVLNVELINDLQVLRKHKLSTVACTPNEKYVDNASLGSDILDAVFRKPDFRNRKKATFVDLLENRFKTLRAIPKTTIRFDSYDTAPFTLHGPHTQKPVFNDEDKEKLWRVVHGATGKEVGWHTQTLARKMRKLLRFYMERETSHITPS